jgi:aminodeoxyfutalosine synthase
VETDEERVDHLLKLRGLQDRTGGFLSFVPLAFQTGGTGIQARASGSVQDAKVIAVSRLMLDNFAHIKAYWVTLGEEMACLGLLFGASDLDGTIGQERVAHAAGAASPEGLAAGRMQRLIQQAGLAPVERDIFYKPVEPECSSCA